MREPAGNSRGLLKDGCLGGRTPLCVAFSAIRCWRWLGARVAAVIGARGRLGRSRSVLLVGPERIRSAREGIRGAAPGRGRSSRVDDALSRDGLPVRSDGARGCGCSVWRIPGACLRRRVDSAMTVGTRRCARCRTVVLPARCPRCPARKAGFGDQVLASAPGGFRPGAPVPRERDVLAVGAMGAVMVLRRVRGCGGVDGVHLCVLARSASGSLLGRCASHAL